MRSRAKQQPPEFYTCTKCKGGVHLIGSDLQGHDVFQCSDCGRKVGRSTLEREQAKLRMQD
jgi:DNA-directed RNA polymerase subunit RPC12/RpoP